ncbi:DoxX family protein [Acuticoccus sediminis]|uniref:DoxX family protein n=1 Tax=Acuticoccus sediminis TaxID=2184697 RepID=A0A8B2NH77_9HYPH|nr:DoxX family protein [Acuticoccus sediminis]RAH96102.1 DoxX family protein [Acuticoccus sediminis]
MTTETEISGTPASRLDVTVARQPRLIIPALRDFYDRFEGVSYALLRAAFGLTIITHGIPKMLGIPHGSMADPMAGSTNLIGNVLSLPFAPQLAMVVALLETFGGLAVALGLATRVFAPMLAVQMAAICLAIGPTYPWIDRDIEYPIMLGFVALAIAIRGGGPYSLDRRLGIEL